METGHPVVKYVVGHYTSDSWHFLALLPLKLDNKAVITIFINGT
jgi:hypothetical protein